MPVYDFSARFETEIKFERDVELIVRSDDGATVWIDGKKIHEDKTLYSAMNFPVLTVEGGKAHKVEIEFKGAESVKKITVNGEEVGYLKTKRNEVSFPLNAGSDAPDGAVICVPMQLGVHQDYIIKFHL